MTQLALNQNAPTKKKTALDLPILIDVFIALYVVSIYLLSFSSVLNVFSKALAFVLMALMGVYMMNKGKLKFGGLFAYFGLFLWVCILSCLWSVNISTSFDKTITILQLFVLTVLLYNYLSKEKKMPYIITVLCIAGTIFSVYTVLYFGVDEYFAGLEEGTRMGGEIANVNTIGLSAAMAMMVSLWKVLYEKKYVYIISAIICSVVAFGSGSRKALIFVFMAIILLFILKGNVQKKLWNLIEIAAVLLVLYFVLKLPVFETVGWRIDSMLNFFKEDGFVDGSTNLRMMMIDAGWQQFQETPFTGIGIGNSSYITKQLINKSTYLHNNYIELLATVGLFGTVFYYLMYVVPFFSTFKMVAKQDKYGILAFSLIIIQFVMHYGAVQYYGKINYIYITLFFLVMDYGKEKFRKNE